MKYEIDDNKITLTQTFNAPRERVFSMFKNPTIQQWWGPSTYPVTVSDQDFTVGGKWHYCMTGRDNEQAWGKAVYDQIDEPYRIVYRDYFSDANGTIDESLPAGKTILSFDEIDGATTITSVSEYESADAVAELVEMGVIDGVKETWTQLENLLLASK